MNDYKITFRTSYDDETSQIITERSEAAARKVFKIQNKGNGFSIIRSELFRENTPATKDQERCALEQIKKIVEDLGPHSYIRAAFEGCFEDAEDSIEDSVAYSMKSRLEDTKQKVAELEGTVSFLRSEVTQMENTIRKLRKDNEDISTKSINHSISPDALEKFSRFVADNVITAGKRVTSAAEDIVDFADQPESQDFLNAVRRHRNAQVELSDLNDLLTMINNLKTSAV